MQAYHISCIDSVKFISHLGEQGSLALSALSGYKFAEIILDELIRDSSMLLLCWVTLPISISQYLVIALKRVFRLSNSYFRAALVLICFDISGEATIINDQARIGFLKELSLLQLYTMVLRAKTPLLSSL